MPQEILRFRVNRLEQQVDALMGLREEMTGLREEVLQLRDAIRMEISALETRLGARIDAGDDESRRVLRGEIRAGDEETRTLMRVLYEDLVHRITVLGETWRPGPV